MENLNNEQKPIDLKNLAVWKKRLIIFIMIDIINIAFSIPYMYFDIGIFTIKIFLDFLWILFLVNFFMIWGIIFLAILEGETSYIKLRNKFKKEN